MYYSVTDFMAVTVLHLKRIGWITEMKELYQQWIIPKANNKKKSDSILSV